MDYFDVAARLFCMNKNTAPAIPFALDKKFWEKSCFAKRSVELSPLYVKRYRGWRTEKKITSHKYWEFTCVLEGGGRLICKKPLTIQKNTVFLVPPGLNHSEQSSGLMDTIWIGFSGSRMNLKRHDDLPCVQSKRLSEIFEQAWLLAEHGNGAIGPELDGLLMVITGLFYRIAAGGATEPGKDCIDRAIRYFNEHFAEKLSIPATAKHFGYSEGYFQRIFKQRTGLTPVAYLTTVRCRHAAHLLEETNWPIARVAGLSGYEDQLYFSRIFRRIHGHCPMELRKKNT
jgi:AraC-like DNA-binding protein